MIKRNWKDKLFDVLEELYMLSNPKVFPYAHGSVPSFFDITELNNFFKLFDTVLRLAANKLPVKCKFVIKETEGESK